ALLSSAVVRSAGVVGIGVLSPPVNTFSSLSVQPQITSGTIATCIASSPSDIDLGCGFHAYLSAGTRSSTRRVGFTSWSNSCRKALDTDMTGTSSGSAGVYHL